MSNREVEEWRERLEQTFGEDGMIGGARISQLYERELAYPAHINESYYGYTVLADSFVSFFMQSLELTHSHCTEQGWQDLGTLFMQQLTNFKTLRGAQNAFLYGYPYGGFALLRDLKDQSLFISAVAQGITTFVAIRGFEGIDPDTFTSETMDLVRKQKMREESRVLREMVRRDSGLPENILADLQRWESLFHYEVHGSALTTASTMTQWRSGITEFPVYPTPDQTADGTFINRFEEVSWMLLRTFPILQLQAGLFGSDWEQKWTVLDDSFHTAISRAPHGVAEAIVTMVNEKFPFGPDTTHFSGDQS